jgi:hypothetical protein
MKHQHGNLPELWKFKAGDATPFQGLRWAETVSCSPCSTSTQKNAASSEE